MYFPFLRLQEIDVKHESANTVCWGTEMIEANVSSVIAMNHVMDTNVQAVRNAQLIWNKENLVQYHTSEFFLFRGHCKL